jgi:5'-nucleotidase
MPDNGGLARLGSFIEDNRKNGRNIMLLDSGDMWSGTLLSNSNEGQLGVQAFRMLGYTAAAVGNHEFDYGTVDNDPEGDDLGALKQRLAEAGFPILAANLIDRSTGAPPDWPGLGRTLLVEKGGFKIGIIGLVTEETPLITFPYVGKSLEFTDVAEVVKTEAPKLRAQGAELIFIVSHLGGECTEFKDIDDLSSCVPNSEAFKLARALEPGTVDVLFGGHTHQRVAHRVNGTLILQSGQYSQYVSVLDIERVAGKPVLHVRPHHLLTGEATGALAESITKLLESAQGPIEEMRSRTLGVALLSPLKRSQGESSPVGNLICAWLQRLHPETEICLVNSGGLRNDFPAGPLTYGALYDVLPFSNIAAIMHLKGSELMEMLTLSTTGGHGVLQTSGLQVTYDQGRDPCPSTDRNGDGKVDQRDRDRLVSVTLADGSALEPERLYPIVTNSFIAAGGDGYAPLINQIPAARIKVSPLGLPFRDDIAEMLQKEKPSVDTTSDSRLFQMRVKRIGEPFNGSCGQD